MMVLGILADLGVVILWLCSFGYCGRRCTSGLQDEDKPLKFWTWMAKLIFIVMAITIVVAVVLGRK